MPAASETTRSRTAATALVLATILGCSAEPPAGTFPVELPENLSGEGRSIAVVGDLQMTPAFVRWVARREFNGPEQQFLMADLQRRQEQLSAIVLVGDLVFSPGSRSDWQRFDAMVAPLAAELPVLPAMGNHDYYCALVVLCTQLVVPGNVLRRFPWIAPGQPYAVADDNVVLVFIDSETGLEAQGQWLREQLPGFESRFDAALVFVHRPPYTESSVPGLVPDARIQEHIVAALSGTTLVPVVISGHVHGYEHLNVEGVHYIVTAGGGGPRSMLGPDRPLDVYRGRDCEVDESGSVLRPFNYLLVTPSAYEIRIDVHGFCRGDAAVDLLESIRLPLTSEFVYDRSHTLAGN